MAGRGSRRGLIGELDGIGSTGGGDGGEAVEWRIPNALSLPGGRYDWYLSPSFETAGERGLWYLLFFPNWADGRVRPAPPRDLRRPPSGAVRLALLRSRNHIDHEHLTETSYRFSVGIAGPSGGLEMAREVRKEFREDCVQHWIALYSRLKLREHLEPDGALVVRIVLKREPPAIGRGVSSRRRRGDSIRDDSDGGISQSMDRQGPNQSSDLCIVCWELAVDCVLYRCGHMCMCYDCAFRLWTSADGDQPMCPICRNPIQDVLKVHKK